MAIYNNKTASSFKKMGIVSILPCALVVLAIYAHYPITKERIIGVYHIDTSFYPGSNANWQKEHFHLSPTTILTEQ